LYDHHDLRVRFSYTKVSRGSDGRPEGDLRVLPATSLRAAVPHGPTWVCCLTPSEARSHRTEDWADIEAMVERDSIDLEKTAAQIQELDGQGSHRAQRLLALRA
jgi:hypothetical protein